MDLKEIGLNDAVLKHLNNSSVDLSNLGRVIAEHKERYLVVMQEGNVEAEITGNMRFSAESREDFPAVGDWVILTSYDPDFAIIREILPRKTTLSRQAIGNYGNIQIIATNIDFALLVQAVDRDYNLNRFERYLAICHNAGVRPIIVLSKADLIDQMELDNIISQIKNRIKDIDVFALSNETGDGLDILSNKMEPNKTYCMMGSSGVGKSTLLNNLIGKSVMRTSELSSSTNKGRHTTSHRELYLLSSGAILIDTPGMREVGVTTNDEGLEITFDWLNKYSQDCRYRDCTHTKEKGCAVIEAVEKGEIDSNAYQNFLRLEKESSYFETSAIEKKRKEKIFGKIVKDSNKRDLKNKKW